MQHQKLHFDHFNFPSRQAVISFQTSSSKPQGFYLPYPKLKKSPDKTSTNQRSSSKSRRLELQAQTQSKYESSKLEEMKSTNNNSIYFNDQNILHSIKYKKSLENSRNDNDESLNFTYFSKEFVISKDKKPVNYHILKDFLSPFKKRPQLVKTSLTKKTKNLTSSKNDSLPQNSKRLPDISLESTENPFDFGAKQASKEVALPRKKLIGGHRKNKALDCKQYNILLEKRDANSSKHSNPDPDSNKKAVNSDNFRDNLNKLKPGQNIETNNESWKEKKKPMSPKSVLKDFSHLLTGLEKNEIMNFKEIFYISPKMKVNPTVFEDKKGYYAASQGDQINYRYEIIEELGKGTFGKVFKVFDHKKQQECALKIMKKDKVYYTQGVNEIKILTSIKEKDPNNSSNIVKMINYFIFRNHVCIVFELLSLSLYGFLKSNRFSGLSYDLIRKIGIQLFQTLTFLYKSQIIHCDFKPENILLKNVNKSGVKLIDLGSSCLVSGRIYTYLQSRYYRSPEILFGMDYGTEIDIWSMGCVLAEMYIGNPIFPGESETDMVSMITEIFGLPDIELIKKCKKKDKFFEFHSDGTFSLKPNLSITKRIPGSKPLKEFLNCDNSEFLNLLEKCFTFDPQKRIKPHNALIHPWIINDLPKEIKQLYLKDCQDLKNELENPEENLLETKTIFVEDGLKGENSSKETSNENDKSQRKKTENRLIFRYPIVETRMKENFLRKTSAGSKTRGYKKEDLERSNGKEKEGTIKVVPAVKNISQIRKITYGSKKKSITFHESPEKDFFS